MQPTTTGPTAESWPFIQNVVAPLADWWRRHASVQRNLASLDAFSQEEMARIAQDVGVAPAELRSLATHCSDAANLLERRLSALGVDLTQLHRDRPAELRDMARLCTMCDSKGRCSRDLAADPKDPAWRTYCPNETALVALARA
jgi:hypothetical protein